MTLKEIYLHPQKQTTLLPEYLKLPSKFHRKIIDLNSSAGTTMQNWNPS